ncbi:MAG TPA: hypothetical protein VGQ53_17650 [Chitinophagaceae bacterium]|jgi:hypothetical protein|nr:hypothetical protein [Chitinophagaceae bacterium]
MKTALNLLLPVILLVSCSKGGDTRAMSPGGVSITGKWNVDSVTTYFYNAAGLLDSSEISYPLSIPGIYYPLYFKFNNDYSWSEALIVRVDTTIVSKGTYSYTSDSTFDLMYPDAVPSMKDEPCKIVSLTNSSFSFSKMFPTVFNGTDSGFIKHVFKLLK